MKIDSAVNSVIQAKEEAVRTQVAFAVEAKRLKTFKSQGDAAVQLLEAATKMGKALHKGQRLDALA